MLEATCDNTQRVVYTASPDGPLDGPLKGTVVSGDTTAITSRTKLDGTTYPDNQIALLSGDSGGSDELPLDTLFRVEGDRKPGTGEDFIGEDVMLHVSSKLASTLGGSLGVPEPK